MPTGSARPWPTASRDWTIRWWTTSAAAGCCVVWCCATAAGKNVETAARKAGFLVNAAAPDVIRLAPPLIITEAQVDSFLVALPGILDTAREAA